MHYAKAKSILSAKNGMNLYRGCSHGCIYCDSRSKCYHMEHDFEDIEVKENAIELLENTLKRKRHKCMLGTGSMTDPYVPLETEVESVRKALLSADANAGCGDTNHCLALSYTSIYQRHRRKHYRHFGLLHRGKSIWRYLF